MVGVDSGTDSGVDSGVDSDIVKDSTEETAQRYTAAQVSIQLQKEKRQGRGDYVRLDLAIVIYDRSKHFEDLGGYIMG